MELLLLQAGNGRCGFGARHRAEQNMRAIGRFSIDALPIAYRLLRLWLAQPIAACPNGTLLRLRWPPHHSPPLLYEIAAGCAL